MGPYNCYVYSKVEGKKRIKKENRFYFMFRNFRPPRKLNVEKVLKKVTK